MGNSPSVDQAMLALDDIQTRKRKESGSRGFNRTTSGRSKSLHVKKTCGIRRDLAHSLDDYDLKDIQRLIKELKRDARGKNLLDEFVDYQTGRSTNKPRLLQLVDQIQPDSERSFDIAEINIGN
jgi:hypothetical protein